MSVSVLLKQNEKHFERSCINCVHINVCSIYRAIAPLINNSFKEHKPFKPEDLAKICKEYMPVAASNVLRKTEGI